MYVAEGDPSHVWVHAYGGTGALVTLDATDPSQTVRSDRAAAQAALMDVVAAPEIALRGPFLTAVGGSVAAGVGCAGWVAAGVGVGLGRRVRRGLRV